MNNETRWKTRHAPVLAATEARQDVTPHATRYVLGWGLLPIVVAFTLVYYPHLREPPQ